MKAKIKAGLQSGATVGGVDTWMDRELCPAEFKDQRLARRFGAVLRQFSEGTAESIPLACQDRANTKAAYRFFANDRVKEEDILSGHFRSTRERFAGVGGTMLVLHDTTELSYRWEKIGLLHKPSTVRAIRGGTSILWVVFRCIRAWWLTPVGLPLGLAAIKFWTRK